MRAGSVDRSEGATRSGEGWIGKKVVVTGDYKDPEGRDLRGIVVGSFGDPSYPALDVRFEDGSLELFWHHELREEREA